MPFPARITGFLAVIRAAATRLMSAGSPEDFQPFLASDRSLTHDPMMLPDMDFGSKGVKSDINVTPLVDVVLVLLLVFMVTAPMMSRGIDVSLLERDLERAHPRREAVVVWRAAAARRGRAARRWLAPMLLSYP